MFVNRKDVRVDQRHKSEVKNRDDSKQVGTHQIRCYTCKKIDHKKSECRYNKNKKQTAKCAEDVCLNVTQCLSIESSRVWCLDSGATTHLCNDPKSFPSMCDSQQGVLNLANSSTSQIVGKGMVQFKTKVREK